MQICVIAILLLLLCRELAKKCTQTSCGEINCIRCLWLVIDIHCKKNHADRLTILLFAFLQCLHLLHIVFYLFIATLWEFNHSIPRWDPKNVFDFFSLEYHIKHFISSTFYDTSPLYSFQISYFRVRQLQNARCMYHHLGSPNQKSFPAQIIFQQILPQR